MIAVTSAIFGGIDERKEIPKQTLDFNEYHFYEGGKGTDRMRALYYKTQSHRFLKEDIIVWVDGKIQIISEDFIEQCVQNLSGVSIMKHSFRDCIYQEIDHIEEGIREGNEYLTTRYAHRPLREQIENYTEQGYPESNGLNDCCIIARRNTTEVNKLFDRWWIECQKDYFDQAAIQFLAWQAGVKINPIIFKEGSFIDVPHIKMK